MSEDRTPAVRRGFFVRACAVPVRRITSVLDNLGPTVTILIRERRLM